MKQELTEALEELSNRPGAPWAEVDPSIAEAIAAARLVERLLPGVCGNCHGDGYEHDHDWTVLDMACLVCHGSGRVWDEGIVEAVAKALPDSEHFSTDEDYHQAARIVLSAIAQLAEAGSQ